MATLYLHPHLLSVLHIESGPGYIVAHILMGSYLDGLLPQNLGPTWVLFALSPC